MKSKNVGFGLDRTEKGITLISLVVTIVVLLILAGISFSMVMGENGIIDKAIKARNMHNLSIVEEQIALKAADYGGEYYIRIYKDRDLEEDNGVGAYIAERLNGTVDDYAFSTEGNRIIIKKDDELQAIGRIQDDGAIDWSRKPIVLEVGSSVTYYPAGATYTWMGKYATLAAITTTIEDGKTKYITDDDVSLSSSLNGNYRITSWKVLSYDESTGKVQIVPASQPSTAVKLEGANGYNNAVYLLNEACKTLFVNPSAGVTANDVRSIKVEDIENAMTTTAVRNAKGERYPVSMRNASDDNKENGYTSNKYYPLIYEKEIRGVINNYANSGNNFMGESEQYFLIERDANSSKEFETNGTTPKKGINGYVQATTNIKPYYTYWGESISSTNTKISAYYTVLCPISNNYWLSSRCVLNNTNHCDFRIRVVKNGRLFANYVFSSTGRQDPESHALLQGSGRQRQWSCLRSWSSWI